jgi:iron complex transport system substrate-binding protein
MTSSDIGSPRGSFQLPSDCNQDDKVADLEQIGSIIVDAAFQLHGKLGPGLVESVYHTVYSRDLSRRGLFVESKRPISFDYDGLWFEDAFVPDLIVERCIVIEVKSSPQILPIHYMQLLTYLRLMDLRLGYVVNFGVPLFKGAVRRVVNEMYGSFQTRG